MASAPNSFADFTDPVAKLLSYGHGNTDFDNWQNYGKDLGITEEHIPELIQLALTRNNPQFKPKDLEEWGAVHAWRTLAQLGAKEAIVPLLDLFDRSQTDEWTDEGMPRFYAVLAPKYPDQVISALSEYLADTSHSDHGRITAMECLAAIAQAHEELKDRCVEALLAELDKHDRNSVDFCSFLVDDLILIGANAEVAAPVIKKAYDAKKLTQ
jgi:hypothetical protein